MVSEYLTREIRDRSAIARDLICSTNGCRDKASVIADSLDVVFAVLVYDLETGKATFDHVSSHCWKLTGYWPRELMEKDIQVLFNISDNESAVDLLLDALKEYGQADVYIKSRRKNGTNFWCHLLAHHAEQTASNKRVTYYAYMSAYDKRSSH